MLWAVTKSSFWGWKGSPEGSLHPRGQEMLRCVETPRAEAGPAETRLGVLCPLPVSARIGFLGRGFAARGLAGAQGFGCPPSLCTPVGCSEPRASRCLVLCASPACWGRIYRKNVRLPPAPAFIFTSCSVPQHLQVRRGSPPSSSSLWDPAEMAQGSFLSLLGAFGASRAVLIPPAWRVGASTGTEDANLGSPGA